ncbi:MutS-related protein [Neolewinella agarilytica]|uniref:MutS domain V n=1 Tax=Neolewinella agarilytica TaxID=478744 RepID=A0A1H9LHR7_9BACT|nr:hypothetical protein [Neolewinella agarilytica]SER10665.1 MutS domain V [Neolewinella agarilytica]
MWKKIKAIFLTGKHAREKKILDAWGQRKTRNYSLYYEKLFFDYQQHDYFIDQQSHDDLDFEKFFTFLDRTTSHIGQQCLYNELRSGQKSPADLQELERRIQALSQRENDALILKLHALRSNDDYLFPHIIHGQYPEASRFLPWIKGLQLLSFSLLLFGTLYPVLYIFFVPIMAVNLFIHYRHKANVGYYANMLSSLKKLHSVAKKISPNLDYLSEAEQTTIKKDLKKIASMLNRLSILKTEKLFKGEISSGFWYLAEVAKFMTLLDVTIFESLIKSVRKEKKAISSIYQLIGEADVALSVLALRQNLPFHCQPVFSTDPRLDVKSLYHPLLEAAVPNDLHLEEENLLITGSNMSGKSTFIKAINLNAISAQVLNTAFADTYRSTVWRFATSVNLEDDLESGSSYYLSEVDRIGEIIQYAKEEKPHLITIDEIFKGTNTIERVASAAAVLGYLAGTAALVIVSTHDLELAELLTSGFALYHFQEKVRDADLSFDYKIKPGVMTERNAIKVLSLAGYPPEVVEKAKNLAQIAYETTSTAPPTPPPSLR